MAKTRSGLYVNVTWLARLMSADTTCQWQIWFKTHYDYSRRASDSDLMKWIADHTRMVSDFTKEHLALGEKCFREAQNQFWVRRKSGLVIAGRPDLVTVDGKDHYAVYDCKTGKPKNSDVMQVMLYMVLLPQCPLCSGRQLDGHLVYKSGQKQDIPFGAIDSTFRNNVSYFLELLEETDPPQKTPHPYECRFCDITTSDCPERLELTDSEANPPEISL